MKKLNEFEDDPFDAPAARYYGAKRMRKTAIEVGNEDAAFLYEIAMYFAHLEILALGGDLKQLAAHPDHLDTDVAIAAREELAKYGKWPIK